MKTEHFKSKPFNLPKRLGFLDQTVEVDQATISAVRNVSPFGNCLVFRAKLNVNEI